MIHLCQIRLSIRHHVKTSFTTSNSIKTFLIILNDDLDLVYQSPCCTIAHVLMFNLVTNVEIRLSINGTKIKSLRIQISSKIIIYNSWSPFGFSKILKICISTTLTDFRKQFTSKDIQFWNIRFVLGDLCSFSVIFPFGNTLDINQYF